MKYGLTAQTPTRDIDVAMDAHLDQLYLSGKDSFPGRILYYAVRSLLSLRGSDLPLACAARQKHARTQRASLQKPSTGKSLLAVLQLVSNPSR